MPFSKTSSGVRESSICCFGVLCFQHVSSVLQPAHTAFPATSSASLFLLPRIMDYCCASQSGRLQSCFSSLEFSFLATWERTKHLVCACVQQVGMEDAQEVLSIGWRMAQPFVECKEQLPAPVGPVGCSILEKPTFFQWHIHGSAHLF